MAAEMSSFEKTLRRVLPENHHIVIAAFATYYGVYKLATMGSKTKTPEPAAAVDRKQAKSTNSLEDKFASGGSWEPSDANVEQYFKWLEKPGNADKLK